MDGAIYLCTLDATPGTNPLHALSLQENIPLRSLVLDFNKIGDKGAGYLATGLQTNTNLWTLRLAYCGLTAKVYPLFNSILVIRALHCYSCDTCRWRAISADGSLSTQVRVLRFVCGDARRVEKIWQQV